MFKKNINITKRISAFLLALIMLLGALPLNVFAEAIHGNNDSVVMESNTTNKEKPSVEPKGTDPEKHTISFNPNGGTGEMKSVEVEDGKEYSLPKNEFKAPEGKEFKNWLMDKDELKECYKLVITKDIELKANWEDIKVNPVKKALNSLFSKDKEELDISDNLVGEAVTNDGEYTGPAHNSVTSSDGKVQIRNFEVFWTSTDGDTIVDTRSWIDGSRYMPAHNAEIQSNFSHEPKMQVNWALSGELQYPKGAMTITIPDMQFENENDLKYPLKGYSIPELKFKEDGSIDFNANYGNATLAYYHDKDEGTYKITNILELAPGASGTFTLTYDKYAGNSRWLKDMSIHESKPVIDLKYNDETLETQDKALKIQQDTKLEAGVYKSGQLFKTWQDDWGEDLKPNNSEDYWYACYEIRAEFKDHLQTNFDYKITDELGEIHEYKNYDELNRRNPQKIIKGEQEIIGYTDIVKKSYSYELTADDKQRLKLTAPVFSEKPVSKDSIEWTERNLNSLKENEAKRDTYNNDNLYKGDPYYLFINRFRRAYILTKIPAKKLGYMDEKKDHYIRIMNEAKLEVSPKNSTDDKFTFTSHSELTDKYKYVPDAKFTAPPGNRFSLDKKTYGRLGRYRLEWHKDKKEYGELMIPYKEYNKTDDIYSNRDVSWKIGTSARVMNETYDSSYGDKDNESAYGKKKVRYEITDDYLYLADNYSKELTSDDYNIKGIGIAINLYDYKFFKDKDKSDYRYQQVFGEVPAKLYLRKESTGEWIKAASFDIETENNDRYSNGGYYEGVKPIIKNVIFEIQETKIDKDLKFHNFEHLFYNDIPYFKIPEGYSSAKIEIETNHHGLNATMFIDGELKPSERVKKYIDSSKNDDYAMDIVLRNDPTMAVYNESNKLIGLQGTTDANANVDRTLELDRKNHGVEMYHAPVLINLRQEKIPEIKRKQSLSKLVSKGQDIRNEPKEKSFVVPTQVNYNENIYNADANKADPLKQIHEQNSGTFYDLLPLGVTGAINVKVSGHNSDLKKTYIDKDTGSANLKTTYEIIPNWRDSGRSMLIVRFHNAKLNDVSKKRDLVTNKPYDNYSAGVLLRYDMIYPWDSYKDYGSKIERNLVAYESGFEKRPDDGLDDSLTSDLESGFKDLKAGYYYKGKNLNQYIGDYLEYEEIKIFTDQEIEWMKDLNPNHDEKRFLYSLASTTVSGDTEANVGLTKHVSTDINPNFTLKSSTKEGGNYQYKIRLQAAHGTSVSNLVFFDSIENYNPLKADEDYGIKQWRGTLSSIDTTYAVMKGIAPKVYVSTKPKLDIEKHNDVSDSTIWKLYKEGDDLSNVQAVAIDLRKNKDGSDFKLEQDTAINVYLNMKAPWNLKEKQIDSKAKALNAIYASNTVTTSLDNKSTKLIYTAYTAVDLKPVTTETQIKATKKHLDKEGKDIALKGNDFTFELKDSEGKVLQTKTNDNKGNITFDPIKYHSWDVGEHTYKIVEVKGDSETTAYDSHEEIVKVKVERSGDSELKATTTYDKDGAAFNNHEVDPITTSIEAKKVYIGKGGLEEKPKAGAFEFILKDTEGKEVAKATNDAEGKVVFEGLEFKPNQIGEHKYTIEEVKGNNPAIEYDSTKKNVTVKVSLTEDFKLKADVVYDNNKTPIFTNTLKSASLQLVKLKEGSKTFTLDEVKDNKGFLTSYKVPEAQKDNVLDGAEYELYKIEADGTEKLVDTLVTKNGISQVVQDIMPGKYKLKETKAPKGYTLNDKDLIFDVTDKEAGTIVAKFATDDGIIDMPSTGGRGTKALMIGGGILVAIMAGVLVVANKKKKEELNK